MKAPTPQSSIGRIVTALFPWLTFAGFHRFIVGKVNADGSLNLDPVPGSKFKPLPSVAQWTLGGAEVAAAVGSEVVIVYLDNDAARPVIAGFAPLSTSKPTGLKIDTAAGSTIAIGATSTTINLGGAGAVPAAKAPDVAAELTKIAAAITSLETVVGTPATLTGALASPATLTAYVTPGDVAATKVVVK